MKTIQSMLLAGLCAASLAACNQSKDSKETADSINNAQDSIQMASTDSSANGAMMTNGQDDAEFATAAANGGMAEVELGKLAGMKAVNADVKAFGAMMASDHAKAGAELTALAKSKNIALPLTLADPEQQHKSDLEAKTGSDFDKAYVDMMVEGHENTAKLFEDEVANGKDPDLKAFASKTLPVIKTHLDKIRKIKAGMK